MRPRKKCPEKFSSLIYHIVRRYSGINTHALMKIAYLIELKYLIEFGEKLTEIEIIRLNRGPIYSNHNNLFKRLEYHKIINIKK